MSDHTEELPAAARDVAYRAGYTFAQENNIGGLSNTELKNLRVIWREKRDAAPINTREYWGFVGALTALGIRLSARGIS